MNNVILQLIELGITVLASLGVGGGAVLCHEFPLQNSSDDDEESQQSITNETNSSEKLSAYHKNLLLIALVAGAASAFISVLVGGGFLLLKAITEFSRNNDVSRDDVTLMLLLAIASGMASFLAVISPETAVQTAKEVRKIDPVELLCRTDSRPGNNR